MAVDLALSPDVIELADLMLEYRDDPLGFVLDCWEWNTGQLKGWHGPDANQREFLTSLGNEIKARRFNGHDPVMPVLMSESSGRGTGKSAMGGWLTWFLLGTRPGSIGTVTAGSYQQLEERTWAEIQRWGKTCLISKYFEIQAGGIYSYEDPENWKVQMQSCKAENAQSFAGQHALTSTSWYLFDEASEVCDEVWETAITGMTDGEPMFFGWGQCVRNTGYFYEVCFGSKSRRWNTRQVNGWTSDFTNKELLQQMKDDYGEDSDTYRVQVLGFPPSASELQYIDRARVDAARRRTIIDSLVDPLIAGFDVSGGGKAWNVIRFRRGLNMNVRPAIRIPGDKDPDRSQRVAICAELLNDQRPEHKLAALFVDTAFGAPIVATLRSMGHTRAHEVAFGGDSPDSHFGNLRAYMYGKLKDALLLGALSADDEKLAQQICLPGYHIREGGSKLMIESKADIQKRGEQSPDDADALALTFAQSVAPQKEQPREVNRYGGRAAGVREVGWMA